MVFSLQKTPIMSVSVQGKWTNNHAAIPTKRQTRLAQLIQATKTKRTTCLDELSKPDVDIEQLLPWQFAKR